MRWSFKQRSWVRPRPIHTEILVLHVPWQRNRPSHQRLPYLHRHQAQDEPRHHPTITTITIQGGQPYHAMGSAQPATFLILPSALSSTSIPKFLDPISSTLPIIPLCHHQPSSTSASSTNNLPPCSTTNHIPHAKQDQCQPTQSRAKPTATPTSTASSGTSTTNQEFSHPWDQTHNHWRFKHRLQNQKAV
jgi:hypothetical protein